MSGEYSLFSTATSQRTRDWFPPREELAIPLCASIEISQVTGR